MSKEERLKLENELLMTKSKAMMINLYLDKLEEIERLKNELEVSRDNEETYRLEMLEITKRLGLDEETLFDDVKDKAEKLKKANKKLSRISNKKEIENFVLKNIIKEAREYVNTWMYNEYELAIPIKEKPNFCDGTVDEIVDKLKEILDKGEDK